MLQQMFYATIVPLVSIAREHRRRWSPRTQWSPRARGKRSKCGGGAEHKAISMIVVAGAEHEAASMGEQLAQSARRSETRSCIYGRAVDIEHEAKAEQKLHL
jgi:hypothetical protein